MVDVAFPTMSVALRLADQVDISRGDMIVEAEDQPWTARELEAMVCWMSDKPLQPGGRYAIKHTTRTARAVDPYSRNRTTGSFILIDEATNDTVGAGMVLGAT